MTNNQFDFIKCIIDNQFKLKDKEALIKIKEYLDNRLVEYEKQETDDSILELNLKEFIGNNFASYELEQLAFNKFYKLISEIKGIDECDIKVIDTLGIYDDISCSHLYPGEQTIIRYEDLLNNFNYSITDKITNQDTNDKIYIK